MKSSIMKTVIPIDASLMQSADDAARELGMSRGELIAEALRLYLRERRRIQISRELDQAHSNGPSAVEKRLVRNLRTRLLLSKIPTLYYSI